MKKFAWIGPAVFLAWALAACTDDASKNFTVPDNLRKIHVRTFENNTYELGIEDLVTHKTVESLLKDARVAVTNEDVADAVIRGRIEKYVRQPIAFDQNNVATLYRIYIAVEVSMIDPRARDKDKQVFWMEPLIDHETTYSTVSPPIETESVAKERLADLLATDVLTRVTEGWINLHK